MSARKLLLLSLILLCGWMARAIDYSADPVKYSEPAIYTEEYGLVIEPDYPPVIGQQIYLRLRTFKPAQRVSVYSDREIEIPVTFQNGYWQGKFTIPADYQTGGHYFIVWIKYPEPPPDKPVYWLKRVITRKPMPNATWSKSEVWYQAVAPAIATPEVLTTVSVEEKEEPLPEPEEEAAASPEARPLVIKGNQTITFTTRSLEGSKEGYTAGTSRTREETLRVNVSGRAADTEIEASLFRSTALGVTQVGEKEEEISILMRRGSWEAYLGDFTADFNETEFTGLDKVLSGARIKGEFENWGIKALYSSPKGQDKFVKMYGDNTQGPYALGFAPVVVNSERVYLNNTLQKRGDDYTVDYRAGTVTFIKNVIDSKTIIQVYYSYRQTLYQHATYGLRGFYKPWPNLKVAATYLEDSDSPAGAADIQSGITREAVNPQRHYVAGADASFVSEQLSADTEIAYSFKNLNLLSTAGTQETGRAGKFNFTSAWGPFGLMGHVKKVGAKFQPLADPDPKQDVWEYGGGLSYRAGSLFGARGNYEYQKFIQSEVEYENLYKTAKAQLTPEKWPSLEYNYAETDESNDPVTGSPIRRVITRNSAETIHQVGFISTSLKGTLEKWLNQSPSEEVTDYSKLNFGLATVSLEKITFSSNVELEERTEPTGLKPYKRTYNLNLSATPSRQYFVSSALNIVEDSVNGQTNVVDLSYKAQPLEIFKTDGKYTITSLADSFPTTAEAVSKHTASFSFDLRPMDYLRLRYLYKPNFTRIERTQTLSYNNEQQQSEVNIIPSKYALLGWLRKTSASFNVNNYDYPGYTVKNNTQDTTSNLYTFKAAPWQMLSTEFNYQVNDGATTTLVSTSEPYTYNTGTSKGSNFDVIAKTSLSEQFSFDTRYTFQKNDQGSNEVASDIVDNKSHTASLKGVWRLSEAWTFSLSGAYTRTTDYLLSAITYTYTPGFGFIYRWSDKLRADFDYAYAKSYSGAETELTTYNLKSKYALSDFVNVTLRVDQEISRAPDYRLTDVTGNVEINL